MLYQRSYALADCFFNCRDVIIKCGQKVAHLENNGLGWWQNANLNGQFEIAICHIE